MMNIDIDAHDLRANWGLDITMIVYNLRYRFGVEPIIRVSSGGKGFHISLPHITLPLTEDEVEREVWDCPGHAAFTRHRGGADVIFSRRGNKTTRPCIDTFDAIDMRRQAGTSRRRKYGRRALDASQAADIERSRS